MLHLYVELNFEKSLPISGLKKEDGGLIHEQLATLKDIFKGFPISFEPTVKDFKGFINAQVSAGFISPDISVKLIELVQKGWKKETSLFF